MFPTKTNIKIVKINGKYCFPSLPTVSLSNWFIKLYDISDISCMRVGIIERVLTVAVKKIVMKATVRTIAKDELVKDRSRLLILICQ